MHLQKHLERGSSRLITLFVKTEAPHKSLRISGHMLALCNHTATAKFWRLAIDIISPLLLIMHLGYASPARI